MADPAFTRSGAAAPNRRLRGGPAGLALAAALAVGAPALAQVQVEPLAAPDLFSTGGGHSDLPADLWRGSSGALAKLVIPELASHPLTPAAAALARHVLEAGANGPEDAGNDPELAGSRAEALLQLGDLPAAQTIAGAAQNLTQLPALSRVAAQAALITGQDDKACAVGDALTLGREGAFWLRLRAYCQARASQTAPAQLTLELAEQQEHRPDFERLMSALLSGPQPGITVQPSLDDALDFAISRKLGLDWASALDGAPASIAVAVAQDAAQPAPARLAAAARAARLGIAVPEAYAAVTPSPTALPPADAPGPLGEATLVALAGSTNDLTLKESAIIMLLRRAKDGPEFQALSRLVAPAIGQLMNAKPVLRQPFMFAMAAAATGDVASAQAARAQVGQGTAPPTQADLAVLDALIAAASTPVDPSAVDALAMAAGPADSPAHARVAGALALVGGFAPLGAQARYDVAGAGAGPGRMPAGRSLALEQAAEQARIGDVALYILETCAEAGPGGLEPADRALMIRALDRHHLEKGFSPVGAAHGRAWRATRPSTAKARASASRRALPSARIISARSAGSRPPGPASAQVSRM